MNTSLSSPNSDLIYDLYGGGFLAQLIRLAPLPDGFTPLPSGPASCRPEIQQNIALEEQVGILYPPG